MRYLSVTSGIEAATAAWHPLGWEPVAFSEIEPFPCKVLAHHYPNVPNLGDMTKFKEWSDYDIDLLVGGTPCQSFSVAGLRKGLDDPRGNLMLTFLAIADRYKPKWIVFENVPGLLSSNGGRDFGTFLGAMEKLRYGFAYRVLDAQFVRTDGCPYAVPQRRRRVFVVGCLGDWGRAAAVLFDSESLRGNPPPRREAGKGVAGTITQGADRGGTADYDNFIPSGTCSGKPTFGTLMANCGTKLWLGNQEALTGDYHVFDAPAYRIALAGNTIGRQPHNGGNGTGFDESGTMYTLTKTDVHVVAFHVDAQPDEMNFSEETTATLTKSQHAGVMQSNMQVRRLTPRECERLQAFPDDYTNIPGASDTTRYKALGNSMAVNVMQLIGERIRYVESVL